MIPPHLDCPPLKRDRINNACDVVSLAPVPGPRGGKLRHFIVGVRVDIQCDGRVCYDAHPGTSWDNVCPLRSMVTDSGLRS